MSKKINEIKKQVKTQFEDIINMIYSGDFVIEPQVDMMIFVAGIKTMIDDDHTLEQIARRLVMEFGGGLSDSITGGTRAETEILKTSS